MDVLKEFLESSTIHGVAHISTAKVTKMKEVLVNSSMRSLHPKMNPVDDNDMKSNKNLVAGTNNQGCMGLHCVHGLSCSNLSDC